MQCSKALLIAAHQHSVYDWISILRRVHYSEYADHASSTQATKHRSRHQMNELPQPDRCDVLIYGGHVIDGTGSKSFSGDVAISGDRICAIGDLRKIRAEQLIDATDHVIAPGFIDVHAHDDQILLKNPEVTPKLSQGVTTVVIGNCGVSLSPWLADQDPPPPMNLIGSQQDYCFPTFESYRLTLERNPPAINAAPLIGHSTLRCSTMQTLNRPATYKETENMRLKLISSLKAGAIGFSTGLAYPPNQAATPEEVITLARELQDFGGVYATHMRNEGDQLFEAMEESFYTARRAKCPLIISHHKCASPKMRGRSLESLAKIDTAAEQHPVGFDVYPYTAGSTILREDHIELSRKILITWSDRKPEACGKTLSDLAVEWNCDLVDAMRRLQPGGGIYFMMDDRDVDNILSHPKSMIGSDGLPHDKHPHPRLWGTFPRVLGYYVREKKLLSLALAIHKMTGLSASTFQLSDRGSIENGKFADIVVFNPTLIRDNASFERPKEIAAGIHSVLVNGVIAWQNNSGTGARTGRILQNKKSTYI
jgi:N-acyl-D-aspartate/D-glutamate deacylase